jgi:hypothetical protein
VSKQKEKKEKPSVVLENTDGTKVSSRPWLKPWAVGQSGNPGGRKAMDPEVRRILEAATPDAARRLAQLVNSPDEKVSLAAIDQVFNRIYGRPVQQVDAEVRTTSVQQAHLQILLELQAKHAGKVIEGDPTAEVIEEGHTQMVEVHDPSDPKK